MSTIKANSWKSLDDRVNNAFAQVVTTQKTTLQYIATTTFTDIMSVTITPRFSTSKVLVMVFLNFVASGHGSIKIYRNSTELTEFEGEPYGSMTNCWTHEYGTGTYNTNGYNSRCHQGNFLDSPNTTSATTYTVKGGTPYSSSYWIGVNHNPMNRTDATWNYKVASCITAIEVLQ